MHSIIRDSIPPPYPAPLIPSYREPVTSPIIGSGYHMGSPMRSTGPPQVTTHYFHAPGGMGTRTIIEEPFEIEQPPHYETVRSVVHRPISIPQPPETHIVEEVVNTPIVVHPPPERKIVREVYERPIQIPQPPERQIVREVYQRPVVYQPPPEKHIVHDIVRKSVWVPQPPKSIMVRKEYDEPPVILDEGLPPVGGVSYAGGPIMHAQPPLYSHILPTESFHPPLNASIPRASVVASPPRLVSSRIL